MVAKQPTPQPARPHFKTPGMKQPDTYDGGSSSRLRIFLQQCKLIFANDEAMFAADQQRTVYASSFLTGKAFNWIQPYLETLDNSDPTFLMNSWTKFESQIDAIFGDPNELKETEQRLETLVMKETDRASSHIATFRSLQT